MGIFDFIKNIGRDTDGDKAKSIQKDLEKALPGKIQNLKVTFEDGTVTLAGKAQSQAVREKAILRAGNVKGVEKIDDEGLKAPAPAEEKTPAASKPQFYTVQKGDSLSKIAQSEYGDASKWEALFEANREVIEDPDLIYPGQQIRIPEL